MLLLTHLDIAFTNCISVAMQTNRRVLDDLENVFMKGLTEGPMADLYAATLDAFYDHSCPEAFAVDASGAHHADTQIKFQQVRLRFGQVPFGLIYTQHMRQGFMP